VTPPRNRKSGDGNPPPTVCALKFYPNEPDARFLSFREGAGNVTSGAGLRPTAKAVDWPRDPTVGATALCPKRLKCLDARHGVRNKSSITHATEAPPVNSLHLPFASVRGPGSCWKLHSLVLPPRQNLYIVHIEPEMISTNGSFQLERQWSLAGREAEMRSSASSLKLSIVGRAIDSVFAKRL
jgi:hypothetical protein